MQAPSNVGFMKVDCASQSWMVFIHTCMQLICMVIHKMQCALLATSSYCQ